MTLFFLTLIPAYIIVRYFNDDADSMSGINPLIKLTFYRI